MTSQGARLLKREVVDESVERLWAELERSFTSPGIDWAFTPLGDRPTVWHSGAWLGGPQNIALSPKVGTGDLDLPRGWWKPWLKVTAGDEAIVYELEPIQIS